MKNVISVIVPVYNVAAYLPECMESILSQDHDKLEVILIDDGSTDASGEICDRYARQDSRVRVIHQKNGGAAAAKNAGLRVATGEYLSFADSDDYLQPGAYSYMLRTRKETGADAGEFSVREVFRSREEDHILYPRRSVMDGVDYLRCYTQGWSCALLWNKLYKRELFEGIFFEEGHRIDDEFFTYQGMMNAQKVVCDPQIIYNYRRRISGAMGNPMAGEQRMLDRLAFMAQRRVKVGSRFPELKREFDTEFLDAMTYFSEYPENTMESLRRIKQQIRSYLLTPGNTVPPRHLWRGLLRVLVTPAEKLLENCRRRENKMDHSDFFS